MLSAFVAMSVWTIFLALLGPYTFLTQLAESGRNLAFLGFMYGLLAGAGHQSVHEGKEGEVASALGELRHEAVLADQSQEDRPDRHGGEGREQRPVARIAIPAAQLEDGERPVKRGGGDMAPEDEEGGHRAPAPSGQSTTRAVWRRMRTSRKGE